MWKSLLLRPSLWVAIISVVAYWDTTALHGSFVYDDAGSVIKNVVVIGKVPWWEAFERDFWGTSMKEPASHKSFRPITTLTFRLNWLYSEMNTFPYRLVNLALHGLVSGLVTHVSAFVFDGNTTSDLIAQLITGFLFGLHPVHAEVVSNITSRGEMLMSLFFLLAFLSYVNNNNNIQTATQSRSSSFMSCIAIYIAPMLFMALSLFSKEQGATALITIVCYDFIAHHSSVVEYLGALYHQRDPSTLRFLRRTIILAIETLGLCILRYCLNGETLPDFIFDQNPAGFSKDRFTRVFSISWVYCLYIYDAIYPRYLCPDWSGRSIDLITSMYDVRILGVVALWTFTAACLVSLILGPPKDATPLYRSCRKIILMAFFAFLFSPFLLSSNLLVVVGLMKADRVIYLPLLGFCMMEALLFKVVFCDGGERRRLSPKMQNNQVLRCGGAHWMGYLLIMSQLMLFAGKVHERNLAWSDSLTLWWSAYQINPKSHHTMYNCGYELSLKKHYDTAEQVMRPIGSAHVDGPSNTFVYAMILFNLNRCKDALRYIDEAMEVIDEKRMAGGTRNQPEYLARTESNLLVAKAHCAHDIQERGRILYEAVQKDPSNDYAIQQAQSLMERVNLMKQYQHMQ